MNTKSNVSKKVFFFLKILFFALVLFFFYDKFKSNWNELVNYEWDLNITYLIASIILHLFVFMIFSHVWCILIKSFGYEVQLKHGFKIGYITNLGRYIPGKLWPVFGMAYLAKQFKIPQETSVTSWIVALIFTLPSAFLVSIIAIFLFPDSYQLDLDSYYYTPGLYIIITATFILSLLLIFAPNRTFAFFNYLLSKFNRPLIEFKIDMKTSLYVFFGYAICWIMYGIAFWLLLKAIVTTDTIPVIPAIGSFVIAYQVGYLAFFAPGGIGIRELVLTTMLSPFIGPIAAGIAIAARVWNMIVELIAALIAWLIKLPSGKRL